MKIIEYKFNCELKQLFKDIQLVLKNNYYTQSHEGLCQCNFYDNNIGTVRARYNDFSENKEFNKISAVIFDNQNKLWLSININMDTYNSPHETKITIKAILDGNEKFELNDVIQKCEIPGVKEIWKIIGNITSDYSTSFEEGYITDPDLSEYIS